MNEENQNIVLGNGCVGGSYTVACGTPATINWDTRQYQSGGCVTPQSPQDYPTFEDNLRPPICPSGCMCPDCELSRLDRRREEDIARRILTHDIINRRMVGNGRSLSELTKTEESLHPSKERRQRTERL